MKKTSLVLLLSACSSVYAELPVVIDHSSYPPSATPVPVNPANVPSANTLYELMGRLEQLQAEVQQLTGKVDEQAYRIDELKKHQTKMYSDFDERLQRIENKANGTDQPTAESPPETDGTDDAAAKEGESLAPASESVPATEPAPVDNPVSASEPAPAVQSAPAAAKPDDIQAPKPKPDTAQVSGPEKQEYQQAYNELRNGHTDQSIEQFNAYLSKYPAGVYANNAQYWLGEAYRVKQDNNAARKAFNDVIEKYPDGSKVPDALLKLGYIEIDQKNTAKAREYLTRVTTEYPKSPAALLAGKKLLKLDEVKN
jgi:tol-pal system protein YbgF